MKTKLKTLLLIVFAVMLCCMAVACGETPPDEPPAHVCTWEKTWKSNEKQHWHECKEHCGMITSLSSHTFREGYCTRCDRTELRYANKVADGKSIVIDGEIDDLWLSGYDFIMEHELNGTQMTVDPAVATVMWDENNLYFMAKVYDNTIVDADRVDFWVTETYRSSGERIYSTAENGGEYVLGLRNDLVFRCVTPENNGYNAENDCQFAVRAHEGYYVVEAKMPKKSSATYEVGHEIGLDICTNHYDEGTGRLACVPWYNRGYYWEDPTVLAKIKLIEFDIIAE